MPLRYFAVEKQPALWYALLATQDYAGDEGVKLRFFGWHVLTGCILCMFLVQGTMQAFTAMTAVKLLGAFNLILALKKKPYSGACAASTPQAACGAGGE